MADEDAASNSDTDLDSPVNCNALNIPYFNAESVYQGTTDHSTTSSDASLYYDSVVVTTIELSDEWWESEYPDNPLRLCKCFSSTLITCLGVPFFIPENPKFSSTHARPSP